MCSLVNFTVTQYCEFNIWVICIKYFRSASMAEKLSCVSPVLQLWSSNPGLVKYNAALYVPEMVTANSLHALA